MLLHPDTLWPRVVEPDRILSMSQMELNCIYAKLIYMKQNKLTLLNWIGWNRTVYMYENRIGIQ